MRELVRSGLRERDEGDGLVHRNPAALDRQEKTPRLLEAAGPRFTPSPFAN